MSRWDWYKPKTKKPPPLHGIKIKRVGATWWGRRWIEALEVVFSADSGRLSRGRAYARAGRTHDLVVKNGKVTAKVTGSLTKPYKVTMMLTAIDESNWKAAIAEMAAQAQFSAELLAGQMPQRIDDVFRDTGVSLFPQRRRDFITECSCPDYSEPCKHVAATYYVLGEALDRDPFLLFELRGKTKDEVLDALRAARGGNEEKPDFHKKTIDLEIAAVKFEAMNSAEYDKPRAPLPLLHFSFEEPTDSGALLRQLGTPSSWNGMLSPADVFGPAIRTAAEKARRIAIADVVEADASPIEIAGKNKVK